MRWEFMNEVTMHAYYLHADTGGTPWEAKLTNRGLSQYYSLLVSDTRHREPSPNIHADIPAYSFSDAREIANEVMKAWRFTPIANWRG